MEFVRRTTNVCTILENDNLIQIEMDGHWCIQYINTIDFLVGQIDPSMTLEVTFKEKVAEAEHIVRAGMLENYTENVLWAEIFNHSVTVFISPNVYQSLRDAFMAEFEKMLEELEPEEILCKFKFTDHSNIQIDVIANKK